MRFRLHVVRQYGFPHSAVWYHDHIFLSRLQSSCSPVNFDHLADYMRFSAILVYHYPVTYSKRLLYMHRKPDKHIKDDISQRNPYYNSENTRSCPNSGN